MQWIRGKNGGAWLVTLVLCWTVLLYQMPALLVWPGTVLLAPAFVCYSERKSGLLAALLMGAVAVVVAGLWQGIAGGCAIALVIGPVCALSVFLRRRSAAFWPSVGYAAAALLVSSMGALFLVWRALGRDPVVVLVEGVSAWLAQSPTRDDLLVGAYMLGLARAVIPPLDTTLLGIVLLPATRSELTRSLLATLEDLVRLNLPVSMVSTAILGGLLSVSWPRWLEGRDMACKFPAPIPPVEKWYIPGNIGRGLMGLVLLCGLLTLVEFELFSMPFQLVWVAASLAFSLQGASVGMHMLRARGMRSGTRWVVVILCFVLFRMLFFLLGLMDQFFDLRKLRKGEKPPRLFRSPNDENQDEEDEP